MTGGPTTPPPSAAELRGSATSEAAAERRRLRIEEEEEGAPIFGGFAGAFADVLENRRAGQEATVRMDLAIVKLAMAVAWKEISEEPIPSDLVAEIGRARTSEEIRIVRDRIVDRLGGEDGEEWFRSFFLALDRNNTGQLDLAFIKDSTGTYRTTGGEEIDPALIGATSDEEAEGLLNDIFGDVPDEGLLIELDLPFVGGRPGPETVAEGQPFFEPKGSFEPGRVLGELPGQARGAREGRRDTRQRYHLGFDSSPASWDPVRRIILKDQLVQGGYLDPDQMAGGSVWAFAEMSAMAVLADEANGIGDPWQIQLDRVRGDPSEAAKRRAKGAGADRAPFTAPAFLAPDMATLTQAVKQSVRQRLGREPTALEMGELIATLDTDYTAEFGVQVAALRSEFDARERGFETDEPQAAGSFRSVNPADRFAEHFEERFAGEIDVRERGAALNQREAIGAATLNMVDGLIGGRR